MDLMASFKRLIYCSSMNHDAGVELSMAWLELPISLNAICGENIFATITSSCRTFSCPLLHAIRSLQISHANTRRTLWILISIDLIIYARLALNAFLFRSGILTIFFLPHAPKFIHLFFAFSTHMQSVQSTVTCQWILHVVAAANSFVPIAIILLIDSTFRCQSRVKQEKRVNSIMLSAQIGFVILLRQLHFHKWLRESKLGVNWMCFREVVTFYRKKKKRFSELYNFSQNCNVVLIVWLSWLCHDSYGAFLCFASLSCRQTFKFMNEYHRRASPHSDFHLSFKQKCVREQRWVIT